MFTGQLCHSLKTPFSKITAICEAASCAEEPVAKQALFVSVTLSCAFTYYEGCQRDRASVSKY